MGSVHYDAIVVGAGFGGSSCAALLAKRGLNVLLLEKNARAGGKAMSFSKRGYTYTAWVVITAPVLNNSLEAVLKELGMVDRVKLVAPEGSQSFYKTASGRYSQMPPMPAGGMDPNVLFDWLEISQEDREVALKFFTDLTMMGAAEINAFRNSTFRDWIGRYDIPKSLYGFFISLMCDGMFMVPVDVLSASEGIRTVQDMILRSGGLFCEGGIGRVAETYAEAVAENGGRAMFRTRTERILVEEGRVTGVATDKGIFDSPIVVSNVGIQPTVLRLVGEEHFDRGYVNYVKDLVPSMGMMGTRYFLKKKLTDAPFGVIFSDDTPWSLEKFHRAKSTGSIPESVVYFEVPSNYDPNAAPRGKQILMTGYWCPADPSISEREKRLWREKGESVLKKVFPNLEGSIESQESYDTRHVSRLTRDQVLPGQGGETIGLGQLVDQCGKYKPSAKAPIRGLFYVGTDAGGYGVGVHQATDSGINVADIVLRYQRTHVGS